MNIIANTKSCPDLKTLNLNPIQVEALKRIHLHNKIDLLSFHDSKKPDIEELERYGIIVEDFSQKSYIFVSKILGCIFFNHLFTSKQIVYNYDPTKVKNKIEIIIRGYTIYGETKFH